MITKVTLTKKKFIIHKKKSELRERTQFGYKPVCSQLATTHVDVATNKIIYVSF